MSKKEIFNLFSFELFDKNLTIFKKIKKLQIKGNHLHQ